MSSSLDALLNVMPISQIYRQLTGVEPRPGGRYRWYGIATWRNGDGYTVSLRDDWQWWHHWPSGDKGGVLDLIVRIRGYRTRREGLRWLSQFTGIAVDDRKFTPAERAEYRELQRRIEKSLPIARSWQRVAAPLADELLFVLKAGLNNLPAILRPPEIGEIKVIQDFQLRINDRARNSDSKRLVQEYECFLRRDPRLTGAMVQLSRIHERADEEWLRGLLEGDGGRRDAT